MSKRTRRRYSNEFKADAVALVEEHGYGAAEAAQRLGIDRGMLDRWRREHRAGGGNAADVPREDARDAELRQLREENRQLRMEREILKKAAAFFANESS